MNYKVALYYNVTLSRIPPPRLSTGFDVTICDIKTSSC